jgi:N-acetylglucosamine-6-sulfatase
MQGKPVPADWRTSIYYHYYQHGAHNVPRHDGVRNERYKLMHFYTDDDYELYDLKNDAQEVNNLAGNPEYAAVLKRMKKELKETRDAYQVPPSIFEAPYEYDRIKLHR